MNPRDMTNEQLAAAVEEMFNSPDFDRIKFEAARRLREHADLEAACGLLGEECRAWRDDTNDSNRDTRLRLGESIDKVNAHPLAAQYVKPKETTDGH